MIDAMREADAAADRDRPLVGRAEELEYLARARRDGVAAVVVGGAPGVGRSRLAAEALAAARAERWSGERVDGATATASIPFGGVAHLAPSGFAGHGDPLGLLLAITDDVRARAARRPLVLVVDDAHLLDEASLAVVRRLVGVPSLFLLLTVRSDVPPPAPVLDLWKEGHAPRLELQALSRAETYHLVALAGGGASDVARQRWLWDHSLGNPLFLRELMTVGPDRTRGVPDRRAAPGPRLTALVRHRLGELTDGERTVLEALVVGGPLPSTTVEALAPAGAVAALVARGLVDEHDDGAVATLALAHPAYDVVLRDRMTAGRTRALRRRLLDVLTAADDPHPRTAVRIAVLRLDQGGDVDTDQLVVAARYAQAAFPQALAERLPADAARVDDLTAAVAAGVPSSRPSTHDLAVAERLARAAWDADRSLTAGLSLTTVLVARGRGTDAAALTGELEARAGTTTERVQVALARAALHFWVLGEAATAIDVLDSCEREAVERDPADASSLGRLRRLRAGIALNVGRVHAAAALATALVDADDEPTPLAAMAAATGTAALALAGRPDDAIALAERFLPVALTHADRVPEVVGQIMLGRLFAARVLGRIDEAEQLAYLCYQPAAEQGSLSGMAVFTAVLGQIALDRGQPAAAARRLGEADVLLAEYDSYGYRPWVLAGLATAHALAGDVEPARAALDLMRATTQQPRYFDPDLDLAEAWCWAADGALGNAVAAASRAAERAHADGLAPFEAAALHALVRFGHPGEAVARLTALAGSMASPLTERYARHAEAAHAGDGAALDEVSLAFEETGALLVAAEAAAQAGDAHHREGRGSRARRAAGRARSLVEACRGAASPALRSSAGVPSLTDREREVAALASRGMTSRAIADRLVVSPRTVESHLYRIFTKLGIADRSELADML